jgi:dTDP-4-dehydrorhamnose reductase
MAADRRILLFGANGQVGHELIRSLSTLGPVSALDRSAADFSRPSSLSPIVDAHRPAIVVIAAAYTAVDKAESEPDLARTVNAEAPGVIAAAAARHGATVVHYSTDYVFDGTKNTPYVEDDATGPTSVYGTTKLAGERAVTEASPQALIFRTSWVYAVRGGNFIKTVLRLARERPALRIVADQVGAPTSASLIADTTADVLARLRDAAPEDPRWGTYHLAPAGEVSWHAYARHIVVRAQALGIPLQAGPDAVEPITTAEYPTPARRPANSRLNTGRIRATFGVHLPDWTVGVNSVLDQMRGA